MKAVCGHQTKRRRLILPHLYRRFKVCSIRWVCDSVLIEMALQVLRRRRLPNPRADGMKSESRTRGMPGHRHGTRYDNSTNVRLLRTTYRLQMIPSRNERKSRHGSMPYWRQSAISVATEDRLNLYVLTGPGMFCIICTASWISESS